MVRDSSHMLITGAFGYVGGRLANHLNRAVDTNKVRLMTSRDTGSIPNWARSADVVQANLLDPQSLTTVLKDIKTVVHLAAVNEIISSEDPDHAFRVNGLGTYNLLKAAVDNGVKRLVYMSTFHVYGVSGHVNMTEGLPTKPIHPYSITHRLSEDFINWFNASYNLETLILRLSNGYGYPADSHVDRWTLVFNDLCRQGVQHGEIKLRSSGVQHRDFIALEDVARAVCHFLALDQGSWGDGLFNLGGNCSMSIYQVAEKISEVFNSKYDKNVPIITGDVSLTDDPSPVKYNTEKLGHTGFDLVGNMEKEIIGTIDLCNNIWDNSESLK